MTVIIGIDPGIHSLGLCVIRDGQVVSVYQHETPRKERKETPDQIEKYKRVIRGAVADMRPHAVGLEDIEYQPWKTGGSVPKGVVKLQSFVKLIAQECQLDGIHVYVQSPGIMSDYEDWATDYFITQTMGKMDISPHLRAAAKHAMKAENTYKLAKARKQL